MVYVKLVLLDVNPECVLFLVLVMLENVPLVNSKLPLLPVLPVQTIAKYVLIKILVPHVTLDINSSLLNVKNVMLIALDVILMEQVNVIVEIVIKDSSSILINVLHVTILHVKPVLLLILVLNVLKLLVKELKIINVQAVLITVMNV